MGVYTLSNLTKYLLILRKVLEHMAIDPILSCQNP
jgi:hypothetical protein